MAVAAAGLGALLVILRAFTYPEGFGLEVDPGWSGYVLMLLAIAETVFAVKTFRSSGEQMPWQQQGGGTATQPPAGSPPPPA